jgi:hypothetical protein
MSRETKAKPTASQMRNYAADFIHKLTARIRLPLDYSIASLRIVDRVIDGLRAGDPHQEHIADTLFGLGSYAGEVLVRHARAVWVDFDDTQRRLFGQPVGIQMPDGRIWNPIGKASNRFLAGPSESLHTFYLLLPGRTHPMTAVTPPTPR